MDWGDVLGVLLEGASAFNPGTDDEERDSPGVQFLAGLGAVAGAVLGVLLAFRLFPPPPPAGWLDLSIEGMTGSRFGGGLTGLLVGVLLGYVASRAGGRLLLRRRPG